MSSSAYIDNKKKYILVIGNELTQGLKHTLNAEKMYSISFIEPKKKLYLSLHYIWANSYLFGNGTEIYKFEAKDFEIVATPLFLGNISKDCSVDNMKKNRSNVYIYDFSVDYDSSAVNDIKDIHKYLMKKKKKVWNVRM